MPTTKKGIMTEPHAVHNHHVKFDEGVKPEDDEEETKRRSKSPAPLPSEVCKYSLFVGNLTIWRKGFRSATANAGFC